MKRFTIIAFSMLISSAALAQEQVTDVVFDKHEVKVNVSNLLLLSFLDGSYEYLINEETSFGVGVLASVGGDILDLDEYRTFSITPYYRQYFSNGYAKGFFIEGFGMLNSGKDEFYTFNEPNFTEEIETEKYTDFALGISVGGKFVTKKGFVAEVYGGLGRNLLNSSGFTDFVGRGGISLGYRF